MSKKRGSSTRAKWFLLLWLGLTEFVLLVGELLGSVVGAWATPQLFFIALGGVFQGIIAPWALGVLLTIVLVTVLVVTTWIIIEHYAKQSEKIADSLPKKVVNRVVNRSVVPFVISAPQNANLLSTEFTRDLPQSLHLKKVHSTVMKEEESLKRHTSSFVTPSEEEKVVEQNNLFAHVVIPGENNESLQHAVISSEARNLCLDRDLSSPLNVINKVESPKNELQQNLNSDLMPPLEELLLLPDAENKAELPSENQIVVRTSTPTQSPITSQFLKPETPPTPVGSDFDDLPPDTPSPFKETPIDDQAQTIYSPFQPGKNKKIDSSTINTSNFFVVEPTDNKVGSLDSCYDNQDSSFVLKSPQSPIIMSVSSEPGTPPTPVSGFDDLPMKTPSPLKATDNQTPKSPFVFSEVKTPPTPVGPDFDISMSTPSQTSPTIIPLSSSSPALQPFNHHFSSPISQIPRRFSFSEVEENENENKENIPLNEEVDCANKSPVSKVSFSHKTSIDIRLSPVKSPKTPVNISLSPVNSSLGTPVGFNLLPTF